MDGEEEGAELIGFKEYLSKLSIIDGSKVEKVASLSHLR